MVSVVAKGTIVGQVTNDDGYYTINVPSDVKTLEFILLGYETVEVDIDGKTTINVTMAEGLELEETVIVGFGKQKKASVVGAIQTINPKELRVPSSNLSTAFAGRLAGVISVQRSGEPGVDGANFWIRGISTFAGATNPLIFIDGIEVSTADMNALAPEVIESFSILKDATATALYGARGANGVLLITTRQGSDMEKARINVRVETQITKPTKTTRFADGPTYMELYNEARFTRGNPTPLFDNEKIEYTRRGYNPIVFPNVNWEDVLFNDYAYNQTVNMNVTGGGSRVTYFMSASLNNDAGMLKKDKQNNFDNNVRQQRYSFQGNIAAALTPTTKATLRLNTQILEYGGSRISTGTLYSEMFQSPTVYFPPYYPLQSGDEHIRFGNKLGGAHPQFGAPLYHNPYSEMVRGYNERSENTNIVSFEVAQDLKFITPGLSAKGLISFKNWSQTTMTRTFDPYFYELTSYTETEPGVFDYTLSEALTQGTTNLSTSTGTTGDRLTNMQVGMDYARTFGKKHDLSAMVIYLQRDYHSNNPGSDYFNTLPTRNQGIAGRVTYGYDRRYMIEANFGYNGSENFDDGKRFGFFPSVAAGYNISNEEFWEPLKDVVSNLKIRGSWGIVGNASIGSARFPYLTQVSMSGNDYVFGENWGTSGSGAVINRYGAEGAHWEEGKKVNFGVDLDLFNSLSLVLDIFNEKRSGIFMQYRTMPVESGIAGDLPPYANIGKVKNEGVELSLDYNKAFLNNDLIINLRGSITYAKNTLLDRDEPNMPFKFQSELNRSLNVNKGLIALGLFKDRAEIDGSPAQRVGSDPEPGDIKYVDMNGDGQITNDDETWIGYPREPQLVYGFGASAQYKGFDLSFFFQGADRVSMMMSGFHPFNSQGSQIYQFIADDHWSESNANPYAAYPRLISGVASHNNFRNSTYWLRDASFLRLKNVEVGYTFKFARIYLSGQNLVTWSPFKHWDPETGSGSGLAYPLLRTMSAGLQLTF
jgi:TonB-linked SusC/RagA family outer membrane protein